MEACKNGTNHVVLVHGAGHGAWCWYKVATSLRAAGYRVTAVDLAASGANQTLLDDVATFSEYSRPVLDMLRELQAGETVVLVGHSFGGMTLALAMETFPEKVAAAVFAAALMPDTASPPSCIIEKCLSGMTPWMDCRFLSSGGNNQHTSLLFGPQYMQERLYQMSSPEDVTLATTLVRPTTMSFRDLQQQSLFSKDRYGTVDTFYVVCSQDLVIPEEFQRWMIERNVVKGVKTISTDHMPMLSAPKELHQCLVDIASAYA